MRKRKVLFVTEASFHPTGYSVYTKEVLNRLHNHPELEVAEVACFTDSNASEIKDIPWKFYANVPDLSNENGLAVYNSSMSNKFGEYIFNHALLDFKPDFVMDIRDWWMLEFEERSPFRDFFNWAIMPTVDAKPQNYQWINTYANADGVFSYSEFGRDVLLEQSKKIKFVDIASPCASDKFFPIENKTALRQSFGIDPSAIIFGTVMRNQRRKLYPDLFKAFRLFLDNNPTMTNVFLYCHTGYPDVGWELPDLIKDNGLSNKVLFTYKCKKCGEIRTLFFNDAVAFCDKCQAFSSTLVGVGNKMEDTDLNKVYNLFDVYVQWANSEGWGMPQLEAAYAGLPVISVNYSAMQSLIANIQGIPIDPIGYYKELETGCLRAVPNNQELAVTIEELAKDKDLRKSISDKCYTNAKAIYNWDYTAKKWADYFLSVPIKDESTTWNSPSRIFHPNTQVPEQILKLSIPDQVNWLIVNVLGKPELINKSIHKRLIKDLMYQASMSATVAGYYYNDFSHPDIEKKYDSFDFEKAYKVCFEIRETLNQWEMARLERMNGNK